MPPDRYRLDVTGTFCPLPILLSAREIRKLRPGDLLEILGDDPGILEDMPVWCERAGHRLVEMVEEGGRSGPWWRRASRSRAADPECIRSRTCSQTGGDCAARRLTWGSAPGRNPPLEAVRPLPR